MRPVFMTQLDRLLDKVVHEVRELTLDLDGYTAEECELVVAEARGRGLGVASQGRRVLIRKLSA